MSKAMNVLLVDDSRAVHALVTEMFANSPVSLFHAFNGAEAVEVLSKNERDYEMILLDWEMPVLSGIEALPELRRLFGSNPIVMVTSKNAMEDIVRALESGATDYIMKPYTKEILFGKLAQILGREVA
ncbi:Chemotaxis protein CheY [Planctomyces bekefii]|uniref:Chemotaxis protein CheY n=1 Tax=Planctomyces bekefii TaxID=1653850 RepID=A0A5C6M3S3_9PLAN|nr:Chemotaxis protein CheY [Planctomyces bekefii]